MKNIHLINEEKITLRIIDLFEKSDPLNNIYVVFNKKSERQRKIVHQFVVYEQDFNSHSELAFNKVFIHFLDIYKVNFITNSLKKYNKIYWFIWGGDIYNRPEIGNSTLSAKTMRILFKLNPLKEVVRILTNPIRGYFFSMGKIRKFTNKIDYLVTTFDQDASLVKTTFKIDLPVKKFIYYASHSASQQNYVSSNKNEKPNILLGNSGHHTNNHADSIMMLSKRTNSFDKVYVPLSYGDKTYIQSIIRMGIKILGEQFIPMTEFLSLEKYTELLGNCDVVIFNSYRQQGFGNIVSLLGMGKKIYLNKRNSIFQNLKDNGFSIYEMSNFEDDINIKKITIENYKLNVKKASALFSEEQVLFMTKKIVNE